MMIDLYQKIFHFILLSIIIVICYSGTLNHSWHLDDFSNIVENKNIHIGNLSWEEITKSFYSSNSGRISRPLANLSFAINYWYSGLDTTSYHVVNIIIHIVCSSFVYLVFINTLNVYKERNKSSVPSHLIHDVALLGTVLWAIHPIQTQAITYIVQRMASMAAMFYIISLYFYLKFRLQDDSRKKILLIILGVLSWMAAMLTKQNAALLPLSIIAYEIILFRAPLKNNLKFRMLVYGSILSFTIATFFFVAGDIIHHFEKAYAVRPFTMWERLITQPVIITRYLTLLLIPVADFLTVETNIFASESLFSPPITFFANIFILILVTLSIYFCRKYPLVCFAIIFYFINHLIESTVIGLELYFEHRNYLPSIFIYLIVSYFFYNIIIFYKKQEKGFLYSIFITLMIFVIFSEGNATFIRNEIWKDEITLNSDIIKKAPLNIRGYNNLAAEYMKLGNHDKAIDYLKQGEQIYKFTPDRYQKNSIGDIYCNAGIIELHTRKNFEKAAQLLLKSVEFDPADHKKHYQLAIAFFKLGDMPNAETAIFNAVQLKDDKPQIYNLFGRILYEEGKYDLAVRVFKEGLELEKSRITYLNLVATYLAMNDYKQANSVLRTLNANEDDLIFHLFKLASSSGTEKEALLNTFITRFFNRQIDYKKWIDEIDENQNYNFIYPDISLFKNKLNEAYLSEMNKRINPLI